MLSAVFILHLYSLLTSAVNIPDPRPASPQIASPEAILINDEYLHRSNETSSFDTVGDSNIYCRQALPEMLPTSVDGCRSTLNSMKRYQDYARQQTFFLAPPGGRGYPRYPSEPPYSITLPEGDCNIIVTTTDQRLSGSFSWKEVRSLTTDILEYCMAKGGTGGRSSIGLPQHSTLEPGWYVYVMGKRPERTSTRLREGADATPVVESIE